MEKLKRVIKIPLERIDEVWILENIEQREKKLYEIAKRGFDILFSLLGFLILLIIFPLVALMVKIDSPGSIFYSQRRIRKKGTIFTLYKFRTMKIGAKENDLSLASSDNFRITRIGKVLRRTHIDELPQFYNILKGDISFVGPRPEAIQLVESFKKEIPYYNLRHLVKPGFTGWAQINYHYTTSVSETREKLQYDLYYIKNRSFFLDLVIILKTAKIIFRK